MNNKDTDHYRKPHVFDPIHNGADECECGLTENADIHESDQAYEERMRPRVVNAPARIWLQAGCDDEVGEIDWKELSHSDVSWCEEKIHNTDIEYARVDPPAAPTGADWGRFREAAKELQEASLLWSPEAMEELGGEPFDPVQQLDEVAYVLHRNLCAAAPPAPEADKALAREIIGNVNNYAEEHTGELSISAFGPLSQRIDAALAQARKETQLVHPDDLADTINKFLFEQYACTIDHPQMHVLKELVQWWPDPASKQERGQP